MLEGRLFADALPLAGLVERKKRSSQEDTPRFDL